MSRVVLNSALLGAGAFGGGTFYLNQAVSTAPPREATHVLGLTPDCPLDRN